MRNKTKIVFVLMGVLLIASASFAQDSDRTIVRWNNIVGVITAINVDNPVGNVDSGTFPWTTQGGHAKVNLKTGATSFDVEGLAIVGTAFSGTPGPVSAVTGCVVCNAGEDTEATLDTAPVPLDAQGNAVFSGQINNIPARCSNPLFLIRISTPAGALGRWIATGAERSIQARGQQN